VPILAAKASCARRDPAPAASEGPHEPVVVSVILVWAWRRRPWRRRLPGAARAGEPSGTMPAAALARRIWSTPCITPAGRPLSPAWCRRSTTWASRSELRQSGPAAEAFTRALSLADIWRAPGSDWRRAQETRASRRRAVARLAEESRRPQLHFTFGDLVSADAATAGATHLGGGVPRV
jgi:hypothetical protein